MAKEYPILFNRAMVQAIIDGRKTETRRIIKTQFKRFLIWENHEDGHTYAFVLMDDGTTKRIKSPYGGPGDVLWVRETWGVAPVLRKIKPSLLPETTRVHYKADYSTNGFVSHFPNWRPNIFMCRWMSRLLLPVVDIDIQRLHDITMEAIMAEGIQLEIRAVKVALGTLKNIYIPNYLQDWISLWDSINAKRGYPWESNPWVWVPKFKLDKVSN